MGLFDKLFSKLTGGPTPTPVTVPAAVVQSRMDAGITVTITGPAGPSVQVSDAEVAERVLEYAFVLTTDPPVLEAADQWWNEDTHRRRRRESPEKAYAWVLPFVSVEIAKLEQLQAAQEWGPHSAGAIAKELRVLIRERRKAKEPCPELLKALYCMCVVADLSASLKFEGAQPHYMARFVDINELRPIKLDFVAMGYQCIESLSKTDVKWLVEAFGEPAEHESFDARWPHIRRNAVARYCWSELRSSNNNAKSLGLRQRTMQEWLNELVRRNIGYFKESQERVAKRQAYVTELATMLDGAWAATRQPFIVADLETTGLSANTDEVIEFAAILVTPEGGIADEFSTLVRASRLVPAEITRLTGITQDAIDREGQRPADAMKAFAAFVGTHPVFFHNAPFDQVFIKKAAGQTGVKFVNPVHDTLPLARQAWPSLASYKLATLAQHVGAAVPTHRALDDAKATLAVLLAARHRVASDR
ncbi:PolC-type DNA polymerase III [Casimicrobium huifangae]|jgi:DNA polymerase-3 subunit epsilon|uniref:3'-5' exonuclease n=1 Tax=Casimicrobium huifangae TaxID=2591109 RepID=UPI001EE1D5C5|nr:3'-5' exonuclease [Casimicrobium huifangae]